MASTLGIVPARGGSKRIVGKNMRPLQGRPLVDWAIDVGRAASCIDRLVVSSESAEILAWAEKRDPSLALARPDALAADESPAVDYVRHALETLDGDFDVVVILQPTSPFTSADDVNRTVALLRSSGADSAVTVMAVDHAIHPLKLKRLAGDRLEPYLEDEAGRFAAHELPPVYVRNGSVYATRTEVIAAGRVIGDDCRAVVMPTERSLDINEELDFAFAEFLLSREA